MKEQLSEKEFDALELFLRNRDSSNFEELVKVYISFYKTWNSTFLVLKNMGLEKFISCLLNGYELELPDVPFYSKNNNRVSFNYPKNSMKKGSFDSNRLIYIEINNTVIFLSEAREIAKTLNELVEYYEKYIKS